MSLKMQAFLVFLGSAASFILIGARLISNTEPPLMLLRIL